MRLASSPANVNVSTLRATSPAEYFHALPASRAMSAVNSSLRAAMRCAGASRIAAPLVRWRRRPRRECRPRAADGCVDVSGLRLGQRRDQLAGELVVDLERRHSGLFRVLQHRDAALASHLAVPSRAPSVWMSKRSSIRVTVWSTRSSIVRGRE